MRTGYAQDARGLLVAHLKLRKGRLGDFKSDRWGFRKMTGLTEQYPVFHYFRHAVRTLMSRAGMDHKARASQAILPDWRTSGWSKYHSDRPSAFRRYRVRCETCSEWNECAWHSTWTDSP